MSTTKSTSLMKRKKTMRMINKISFGINLFYWLSIGLSSLNILFSKKSWFFSQQFNLIGIQSIALLAFVGMCIYGKFTKHRTFLHSITFGLLSALCVFMILPIAAPYYIVGFASHIVLDLLNHKKVQLLYPTKIGQFCFNIASSDGTVNYTICAVASVIALLEIYFILR